METQPLYREGAKTVQLAALQQKTQFLLKQLVNRAAGLQHVFAAEVDHAASCFIEWMIQLIFAFQTISDVHFLREWAVYN